MLDTKRKGFTPVELLFVILLIGILVLVAVSFLNTSRVKARDAKRVVDIRRIQTALEFYYLEEDTYPEIEQPIALGSPQYMKLCDQNSGGFVPQETNCRVEFINPLPSDPDEKMSYVYVGNDDGYTVRFETQEDTDLGGGGVYFAHSETIDRDPEIK